MTVLSRMPRKVHPKTNAKDAWYYENAKSIDVYIETDEHFVCSVRIPRRYLQDWIERTEER